MLTYSEAKTKVNMKKSEPIPKWEVFGFSDSAFVNEQAGANASACFAINISFSPVQLDGYNIVTVLKERQVVPIRNQVIKILCKAHLNLTGFEPIQ